LGQVDTMTQGLLRPNPGGSRTSWARSRKIGNSQKPLFSLTESLVDLIKLRAHYHLQTRKRDFREVNLGNEAEPECKDGCKSSGSCYIVQMNSA
jgi:hypothetical protein